MNDFPTELQHVSRCMLAVIVHEEFEGIELPTEVTLYVKLQYSPAEQVAQIVSVRMVI